MDIYKALYTRIFNAVTDALDALDSQNFGQAKHLLMQAQLDCEALYIQETEDSGR